jgi:hypothetical protein
VLGLTVPFPGNVYGALRMAQTDARRSRPATRIAIGGGYVNTELRGLRDPRLFDYVDYVTLDDGEAPLLALLEHLREPTRPLLRTFVRDDGEIAWRCHRRHAPRRAAALTPARRATPACRSIATCRWSSCSTRCTGCGPTGGGTSSPSPTAATGRSAASATSRSTTSAATIRGRRRSARRSHRGDVAETGQTGFHLVDEAAPPAGLRALAERCSRARRHDHLVGQHPLREDLHARAVQLLARSGCVAVSGGLEVASDRLLALMKKGVTVEQVARVTRAFTDAGVMVHAYLMYGFPTETEQETIDSARARAPAVRRRLRAVGVLAPLRRHRAQPDRPAPRAVRHHAAPAKAVTFAENEVGFDDPTGVDHDRLGVGLRKALYNYMHGLGLDVDVRRWFDDGSKRKVPPARVPPDLVERALRG